MTVAELIAKLQTFDQSLPVWLEMDAGYGDVTDLDMDARNEAVVLSNCDPWGNAKREASEASRRANYLAAGRMRGEVE